VLGVKNSHCCDDPRAVARNAIRAGRLAKLRIADHLMARPFPMPRDAAAEATGID
jgi:hypothetical protein